MLVFGILAMFLFAFIGMSREVLILFLAICAAAYFLLRRRILRKSIPEDWPRWRITRTEQA